MTTITQTMADCKAVELNSDTEYARSFGIEKGDTLFLTGFRNADHGDFILVTIDGLHQLDTYDETYTVLDENSVGVLVGSLKSFKDKKESDDILSAEFLEVAG